MPVGWKNHIASDPEILRGKPRLKGTRIPVGLVLGYLAAGKTAENIIAGFPDLTRDQIAACSRSVKSSGALSRQRSARSKGLSLFRTAASVFPKTDA